MTTTTIATLANDISVADDEVYRAHLDTFAKITNAQCHIVVIAPKINSFVLCAQFEPRRQHTNTNKQTENMKTKMMKKLFQTFVDGFCVDVCACLDEWWGRSRVWKYVKNTENTFWWWQMEMAKEMNAMHDSVVCWANEIAWISRWQRARVFDNFFNGKSMTWWFLNIIDVILI